MTFNKGDLIYCEKYDKYALYLDKGYWNGWITVYIFDAGEKTQVHDDIWEIV
jgi:hypothetical protein